MFISMIPNAKPAFLVLGRTSTHGCSHLTLVGSLLRGALDQNVAR